MACIPLVSHNTREEHLIQNKISLSSGAMSVCSRCPGQSWGGPCQCHAQPCSHVPCAPAAALSAPGTPWWQRQSWRCLAWSQSWKCQGQDRHLWWLACCLRSPALPHKPPHQDCKCCPGAPQLLKNQCSELQTLQVLLYQYLHNSMACKCI